MPLARAAIASGATVPTGDEVSRLETASVDAREQAWLAALDRLVALERGGGGWALAAPPRGRPAPATAPLRLAELLAAPLGLAEWDVVALRSPGTPAAALALLTGYERSGRSSYLAVAARAGDLLIRTQLPSGGWFAEVAVEGDRPAWWFAATIRRTILDDDVTTGGARLLLALWRATGDRRYRTGAERALALLRDAQLASGAWPLVWRPRWKRVVWPTFEDFATINDDTTPAAIETLLAAADVLGRDDLRAAARRGGEWLLAVQAPEGGWAQQYDSAGQPARGRRFELPALASWETRCAAEALAALADATGDGRYCAAVARAVAWLAASALRPGCWARFRAVGAGAPLYVVDDGTPVATPASGRPGYDWVGEFGIGGFLDRFGGAAARCAVGAEVERDVDGLAVVPVAGDPGRCPGDAPPGQRGGPPDDVRALVARAVLMQHALMPPAASMCSAAEHEERGGDEAHARGEVVPP